MCPKEAVLLQQPEEKQKWHRGCSRLWEEVFEDKEDFVSYYMDSTWLENQVLLLPEKNTGEIRSMLHMNPYIVKLKQETVVLHYLVGVCTQKKFRHRGYMDRLLRQSLYYLKNKGEPFTYLMPASEDIYRPYGFVPVAQAQKATVFFERKQDTDKAVTESIQILPYETLTEERKERTVQWFAAHKKGIYAVHDKGFLEKQNQWMKAYGGSVLTAWSGGTCVGTTAWIWENQNHESVELVEILWKKKKEMALYTCFCAYIARKIGCDFLEVQWQETGEMPEAVCKRCRLEQPHCSTMLRPLDIKWFLQRLPFMETWGMETVVTIVDSVIEENTVTYAWKYVPHTLNEVWSTHLPSQHCVSLETLVQYWLGTTSVYFPEFV